MRIKFRETTAEAVRVTRIKLGMDPGSVVNLAELRLPLAKHPYVSADGARWSSVALMEERNRLLASAFRRNKIAAQAA